MPRSTKDQRMMDFILNRVSPAKRGDAAWIYNYLRGGDHGRFDPLNRQEARDAVLRVMKGEAS